MSREINPFGLRISPQLKSRLEEKAHQNRRSLNAEIADRLERSFADEPLRAGALDLNGLLSAGLIISTGEPPANPAAQFLLEQAREAAQRVAQLAYQNNLHKTATVNPEKSQK